MYSLDSLYEKLESFPSYSDTIRKLSATDRIEKLSDIFKIYVPTMMSKEIYIKLSAAVRMSLDKKNTVYAVRQLNSNYAAFKTGIFRGIMGGADSFSIIGASGIGKSAAIDQAVNLIYEEMKSTQSFPCQNQEYRVVAPVIKIQCPYDCSAKSMLLGILREVDRVIDTDYSIKLGGRAVTTDTLIGMLCQVCINHIGLLIIDEIQNVTTHKNGVTLLNLLTQLINSSGISICLVGTPECIPFFKSSFRLARRVDGLRYFPMEFGDEFVSFCEQVWGFQYTRGYAKLTPKILEFLYENSAGVTAVVMAIIAAANEEAIISGREVIDIGVLNQVKTKRLSTFLSDLLPPKKKMQPKRSAPVSDHPNISVDSEVNHGGDHVSLLQIYNTFPKNGDIVSVLRQYFPIEVI